MRYVSRHSDPDRLFEYVPHYFRRIEREKQAQEKTRIREEMKGKIEQEIAKAETRKKTWTGMGKRYLWNFVDLSLQASKETTQWTQAIPCTRSLRNAC